MSNYITRSEEHNWFLAPSLLRTMSSSSPLRYSQVCYMALAFCMLLNSVTVANESVTYSAIHCRKHSALLTDFNAKGDGMTLNTKAFEDAIYHLSNLTEDGGAQLIVPPGKYVTGNIILLNLRHFTLFLHKGAEIILTTEESEFELLKPIPSYDQRETRFGSLIYGVNLTDIVITGDNGKLNGQGATWWKRLHRPVMITTLPGLIEIVSSDQVQISNLTLIDSPYWNVHPLYSSNVLIQGLTITAPADSPDTHGIIPDSSSNVLIQDNYIATGGDCIGIKSGLNEDGIRVGIPSQHIVIKRLTCISPSGAGIALGGEMSGGIQDVRAMELNMINTESCVSIKTGTARGNYIKDIFVETVLMKTMKYVFLMSSSYDNETGGDHLHPSRIPVVENIVYKDMIAENVTQSASLAGIMGFDFKGICISNVKIKLARKAKRVQWECSDVEGVTYDVEPRPCSLLPEKPVVGIDGCKFPIERLQFEEFHLKKCTA